MLVIFQRHWKDGVQDAKWILPTMGDLTYKRRNTVNYCSSLYWDVVIKDNVVKLIHTRWTQMRFNRLLKDYKIDCFLYPYRMGHEILVGSTIKKKWNKVKNRILKSEDDKHSKSAEDGWKVLLNEKCINILYFNVVISWSGLWCHRNYYDLQQAVKITPSYAVCIKYIMLW